MTGNDLVINKQFHSIEARLRLPLWNWNSFQLMISCQCSTQEWLF